MTTMIFVRHGQSLGNLNGEFLGHTDLDLSERGYMQAKKTAEYIAKNYKIDKIYSSDLLRARNTAKAIADLLGMEIITDKNLREIYAGEWEKKTFSQLEEQFPEEYTIWKNDIGRACCTGGESITELQKRAYSETVKIAEENPGKTVLIATHATFIRVMECIWRRVDAEKMKDIPWVRNASVTVVKYDGGVWNEEVSGEDFFLGELRSSLPANV